MVNMQQRIEALRTEKGLSRPALAAALGFPKGSVDKFETGRQTPTKEQQEKMASFFAVSLFYLRGESSDRTKMEHWADMDPEDFVDTPIAPAAPPPHCPKASGRGGPRRRQQRIRHIPAQQILPGNGPRHASGRASLSGGTAYSV